MRYEDYVKDGHLLYANLASTVAEILRAAIAQKKYLRLQQIQHRAKSPKSLLDKLKEFGGAQAIEIEKRAKDIGGCRIIFYTNSDVTGFIGSDILPTNFEIDWNRTKIHQPSVIQKDGQSYFISNNYVVKLKAERTRLPEYALINDMWCEVQVQTSLNHAWSEMEHDIIYKNPPLAGFGGNLMKSISERMDTIARDYLLPAGYEFQKVVSDYERLASGKQLFDRDALKALGGCEDNETRYDLLRRFVDYVLPNYDDIDSVQDEVRQSVCRVLKASRDYAAKTEDSHSRRLSELIVNLGLDVIDKIRYRGTAAVRQSIVVLSELYREATTDHERIRIVKSVEKLATNDFDVWNQAGPIVQQLLIEWILGLVEIDRRSFRDLILTILAKCVQSDVRGTSQTEVDLFTIHQGSITSADSVAEVRTTAIRLLCDLLKESEGVANGRGVMNALSAATRMPQHGGTSERIGLMIIGNCVQIFEFYCTVAPLLEFELRQKIEHDALWLWRNQARSSRIGQGENLNEARESLATIIGRLKVIINSDRQFVIYKTLVGYDSVFESHWTDTSFDHQRLQTERTAKLNSFISEINQTNFEAWLLVLSRCARTESNDLATFPSFGKFLEALTNAQPALVFQSLDRLDDKLARFLPALLAGFETGTMKSEVSAKLRRWLYEGKYVAQVLHHEAFTSRPDCRLIEIGIEKAILLKCSDAISAGLQAIIKQYKHVGSRRLVDKAFMPAVEFLSQQNHTGWINNLVIGDAERVLFEDLSSTQATTVLLALKHRPEIDFGLEEVLMAMITKWPTKIVDFFVERFQVAALGLSEGYFDAVPTRADISAGLAGVTKYIVLQARQLHRDGTRPGYGDASIVSSLIPSLTDELEQLLVGFSDSESEWEFVTAVLGHYGHTAAPHCVFKALVARMPDDHPLLERVDLGLSQIGVVSGEFGFVEAYETKKDEMKDWLTDSRVKIRQFAIRRGRTLDNQIADERRRAVERHERRRLDFGGN